MSFIVTQSSQKIFFKDLENAPISIEDIAQGLSNLCRFTGQCHKFYSVAEHCVLGAKYIKYELKNHEAAKLFLLHDATEAYLGDVSAPLKNHLGSIYTDLEATLSDRIYRSFSLKPSEDDLALVKNIDIAMCITERDCMLDCSVRWSDKYEKAERLPVAIGNWEPRYARIYFLDLFDILWAKTA